MHATWASAHCFGDRVGCHCDGVYKVTLSLASRQIVQLLQISCCGRLQWLCHLMIHNGIYTFHCLSCPCRQPQARSTCACGVLLCMQVHGVTCIWRY